MPIGDCRQQLIWISSGVCQLFCVSHHDQQVSVWRCLWNVMLLAALGRDAPNIARSRIEAAIDVHAAC